MRRRLRATQPQARARPYRLRSGREPSIAGNHNSDEPVASQEARKRDTRLLCTPNSLEKNSIKTKIREESGPRRQSGHPTLTRFIGSSRLQFRSFGCYWQAPNKPGTPRAHPELIVFATGYRAVIGRERYRHLVIQPQQVRKPNPQPRTVLPSAASNQTELSYCGLPVLEGGTIPVTDSMTGSELFSSILAELKGE